MNKKFTKLIAALALLTLLIPLTGWGQTRGTVQDVLTADLFAATSTTYTNFSGVTVTSDAVFAGNSAKTSSGGIQLRSKNSNSGIVSTTSGGTIHSVSIVVESGSNTLDIYGKNTAYSAASDLYNNSTQGTKIGSISATGTVDLGDYVDDYEFIGLRSNNGALYLTSITITWTTAGGGGSQLTSSDLALTDAPVALNFDLYNNAAAQTVSFTTSSTGAVTVSGGDGYVTTSVSGTTITVNPVAVTPSAQTITVSQAADATYAAGSVTFTVSVTDATPVPTHYAYFSVNGDIINTDEVAEGAAITFPTNPADINGKSFVGWATATINGTTNIAPEMVTSANMGNSNVTFYAVFAYVTPGTAQNASNTITPNTANIPTAYGSGFNAYSLNGVNFQIQQMYKNSGKLQWRAAGNINGTGTMYNSDAMQNIQSVVLTYNSTDANKNFTLKVGNTANPTNGTEITPTSNDLVYTFDCSGGNYDYFVLTNGSGAGYLDQLVINYMTGTPATYSDYCTTVEAPTVATPTFSPAAGTYTEAQSVTISCTTTGAAIHYTLDGTVPDETSATYSAPINIASTTTVKAIAINGGVSSAVATATYTINLPSVATPTFSPAAGTYTEAQNVTISTTTADATIYYTTDGTDPTTSSSVYSSPITVSTTTTVKAMAVKAGMNNSEVATATYTIELPLNTMQAIFDRATEVGSTATDVNIALQNWVVSGVSTNGKNVFVTDGTKGFVIFNKDGGMGFSVGNVLSGTVSCKVQLYNGFAEITLLNTTTSGISIATGGTVTAANIAMADLAGVNTGALVHYNNLTCSVNNNKYYLSDGTTTIQVYTSLYDFGSTLVAGHVYNITGVYQQFNNTLEVLPRSADDIDEVVSATPSIMLSQNTINAPAAGAGGTLTVTYNNITTVAAEVAFYESDGTTPATCDWVTLDINTSDNVEYLIDANTGAARTAYFKVWAYDDEMNEVYSELVTINQAQYVVDYATLPFSFDGVYADIEGTAGLTESGIDHSDYSSSPRLKFNTQGDYLILHFNDVPGELSFNIKGNSLSGTYAFSVLTSTDGETYTSIASYTSISGTGSGDSKTISNLATNVRYIKWEYTTKDGGNVGLGNIELAAYVAPTPTIILNSYSINATAAETDGTLAVTYTEIETSAGVEIIWCDENGDALSNQSAYEDWLLAVFATGDINTIEYTIGANDGSARTAYFKVYGVDAEVNDVYSDLVTISQAAYVAPVSGTWVLTTLAELTPADVFVIVGNNGDTYAMSNDNDTSAPAAVEITVNNNTLSNPADNIQWNLIITDAGYIFYPAYNAANYLYCTNTNNGVKVGTGGAKHFTLSDNGYLTTTETTIQRYLGIYNSQDWRCYDSEGGNIAGQTFSFFKKVSDPVLYTKTIENGYGDDFNQDNHPNYDYYLIAPPVASVTPSIENGFLNANGYDLYYFNQDNEHAEWINYKDQNDGGFNLVSGKGYLYSSYDDNTELTFRGQPYFGNGIVNLDYTDGNNFAGWNLIGNPYATSATPNLPYYRINAEGNGLKTETENNTPVAAMEGVFVHANASQTYVIFAENRSSNTSNKVESLNVKVARNRGTVLDNAIIRFDGGAMLDKFQLFENSTKLYITEGNQDYAVVRSNNEGETPVSFKAAENGSYTLSVEAKDVEMNYLHLIDNMTGADVDLLATPSYSFEARTTDYASRFRLVFSANNGSNENGNETFAYYNGSEWVIANEGDATLQVVDMMGRVLRSADNARTVSTNDLTPGVYMLRLINGENVRTQKIIVK